MDLLTEAYPIAMTKTKRTRKTRSDVKLTPDRLSTIERCLVLRMNQHDIAKIAGINVATVSTVRLVLAWMGRL